MNVRRPITLIALPLLIGLGLGAPQASAQTAPAEAPAKPAATCPQAASTRCAGAEKCAKCANRETCAKCGKAMNAERCAKCAGHAGGAAATKPADCPMAEKDTPAHSGMMTEKRGMMDARLDALVKTMNASEGQAKVDAMAAVINELIAQREEMKGMMAHMAMPMGHPAVSHPDPADAHACPGHVPAGTPPATTH